MTDHNVTLPVDVERIQRLLPHRFPFLLVDRVIELELGKRVTAIKNVTINEPFFQGHFPSQPVMPGVLIVEALAQAAGVLFQLSANPDEDAGVPLYYLVKIDKARFKAMVVPGDQLQLDVELTRQLRGMGMFSAHASVAGKEVASCELMCAGRGD